MAPIKDSPAAQKEAKPENIPTIEIHNPSEISIDKDATDGFVPLSKSSSTQDLQVDSAAESRVGGDDEELSYQYTTDPKKFQTIQDDSDGPAEASQKFRTMYRFVLYETATRFYLVGHDMHERHFRVLKIDRTSPPGHLNIFEDENVYDRQSLNDLLTTIGDGNRGSGGLKTKFNSWGLLGFIRFTEAYYMILITKRTQAAMIGGHYIFQIEATELVPLTTGSTSRFQRDRNPEEARYLGILQSLDLTKFFYYSLTYDITNTLQENMVRDREALNKGVIQQSQEGNEMFVWNHHLLGPAHDALKNPYDWCIPVIHGYVEQASLSVFGKRLYLTIVARRSRFFAGARYLKRGANDLGYVANDVETEQIVSVMETTSFHAPGPSLFANHNLTSYVQHRGSIPLHWSQDNSGVTPKPDISMNFIDPFYSSAALHFDDLFRRYGAPVYILNLIKARERTPRESKLLVEFEKAVAFLNQSLPNNKKVLYKAFDMSRAAKTRGQDVVGVLELIAEDIMQVTSFFQNGDYINSQPKMQNGVARTNCIDCLDRTNAAQFVIGKRALGHQLQALGIINDANLVYDSDLVNTFTHMYHAHGDTIAIQYGGSHLAHTLSTYRKLNEWKNHSRDMVESFKRYYHNSFLDSQRQEAYNLFLGNYIYAQGQPMLWDLPSDHFLHHQDPRDFLTRITRHYANWYTPGYLTSRSLPQYQPSKVLLSQSHGTHSHPSIDLVDNYWLGYYRPIAISSLVKLLSWKLSSRPRYLPETPASELARNPSPFVPRKREHLEPPDSPGKINKKPHVTILDPASDHIHPARSLSSRALLSAKDEEVVAQHPPRYSLLPADKSQWTLNQWYYNSLSPTVTEEDEYVAYISHPLNLPLVTFLSNDDIHDADFAAYLSLPDTIYPSSSSPTLSSSQKAGKGDVELDVQEENLADFTEFLALAEIEDPLTVGDMDGGRKRYKAYRQWLKGKSFFKQSKVDPEYRSSE